MEAFLTALEVERNVAATGGDVSHFKDARHFASWFGLTPKEFSSGNTRRLGRITKRGDRSLRMLLTHGARAVLRAAALGRNAQRKLDDSRTWVTTVQGRTQHNKAACALADRLAHICYAVLRDHVGYDTPAQRPHRTLVRSAFAISARGFHRFTRLSFAPRLIAHHGKPGYSHAIWRR